MSAVRRTASEARQLALAFVEKQNPQYSVSSRGMITLSGTTYIVPIQIVSANYAPNYRKVKVPMYGGNLSWQ